MAQRVKKQKQAPPVVNDGLNGKERRARNLKLKHEAKAKADEAGLLWDDTIPAASFFEDFDAAYEKATARGPKPTAEELEAIAKREDEAAEQKAAETVELTETKKTLAAAKATLLGTSAGPAVVYDSTVDATKSAEESAAVFASANENEEEQHVDEALVEAGSFKELAKREAEEAAKKAAEEAPVQTEEPEAKANKPLSKKEKAELKRLKKAEKKANKIAAELVTKITGDASYAEATVETRNGEPPVEEVAPVQTETTEENTPEPVAEPTQTEPVVEAKPEPVKEAPKPKADLKLVVNNEHTQGAQKLYGTAFTPERAAMLADAYRCLALAIRLEATANALTDPTEKEIKLKLRDTALRNALAKENEAFSVASLKQAA